MRPRAILLWAALSAAAALCAGVGSAQEPGPVFPAPFVVEHAVIHHDADGGVFAAEPVRDSYGGSWIVSERADGSRLIVDLARRELTEVRPREGRYWVIGFERLAQLQRELAALEGEGATKATGNEVEVRALRVVEVGDDGMAGKRRDAGPGLRARPGVRRVQVVAEGDGAVLLEAWFDPAYRLTGRALDLLDELEREVVGAAAGPEARERGRALSMARREADGALPIATLRPSGRDGGLVEDSVLRVEALQSMPAELVTVPEGLRRAPHPLELMVAHAEREAELARRMGGGGR